MRVLVLPLQLWATVENIPLFLKLYLSLSIKYKTMIEIEMIDVEGKSEGISLWHP